MNPPKSETMESFPIFFTKTTMAALREISDYQRRKGLPSPEKLGPLIERLLCEHAEMLLARKRLKIRKWDARPPNGRPKKSVNQVLN